MRNVFVHRMDFDNPGDANSTPFHHLDNAQRGFLVDYSFLPNLSGWEFDNVIIGGGGMANKFVTHIKDFLHSCTIKNVVIWGVGWEVNNPALDDLAKSATMLGIREWLPDSVYKNYWVPCVSVLHPSIEKSLKILPTKNFLIIDHWKRQKIAFDGLEHTRISNRSHSMHTVIETIADHRSIITSSYHGAYWGILLNKRVIFVSDPWMAKCATLKYKIPQAENFSFDLLDAAEKYPDAFEECRQANLTFKQRFLNL